MLDNISVLNAVHLNFLFSKESWKFKYIMISTKIWRSPTVFDIVWILLNSSPKNEKFTHPQANYNVDEFVFFPQIWRNVARHHLLANGSEWVPSEWESKQLIKTHHNSSQVIHTTPVHQLMSCEAKSCVFVRNKSIIKTFLTSNCNFWPKYKSIIMIPPVKKSISCCLSHQNPATCLFRAVLACKRCLIWCRFLSWFRPEHFFTGGSNVMDYFVFSRCSLMDWSGVDYCNVFISCLDSHSDGTHSLQSIHYWARDVMLHLITN